MLIKYANWIADVRSVCFPYCLQRQENGRYVVLNRRYKPLGFYTLDWINYEDYPIAIPIDGLTKKIAKQLAYNGEDQGDCIYLYSRGCNPFESSSHMSAYLKRLEILSKLAVVPEEKIVWPTAK